MVKEPSEDGQPAKAEEPSTDKAGKAATPNELQKLLRSRTVLVILAVLVVAIVILTWPPSFVNIFSSQGSNTALEKLDTCKNESFLAAKNDCYRELAFSTNQSYFCNKVFNASKVSESCFAKLAIDANSKKSCENIKDTKARGYCIAVLAINKIELPLCDNIDDRGWKNYCYAQLAILAEKPDTCLKIEGENEISDCYVNMAKNLSSGPTCTYILDEAKRDDCYLSVGTANTDALLCAEILQPPKKWTCYHRVAQATGDISLCSHITESLSANCIKAVKEAFPQRFEE